MKKFILLSFILSSQLAYGYQHGWGGNPDAEVIRPAEIHVFTSSTTDDFFVILDGDGNVHAHLLSEVEVQDTSYTTAVLANDGKVVYEFLDVNSNTNLIPTISGSESRFPRIIRVTAVHAVTAETAASGTIIVMFDAEGNIYAHHLNGESDVKGGISTEVMVVNNGAIIYDFKDAEIHWQQSR